MVAQLCSVGLLYYPCSAYFTMCRITFLRCVKHAQYPLALILNFYVANRLASRRYDTHPNAVLPST